MRSSDSIAKLMAALAQAQAEMLPAVKRAVNDYFHTKYATLAEVAQACIPLLAKHGIAVTQPASGGGKSVTVTTHLHLGDEWIEEDMTVEPRPEPLKDKAGNPIPGTEAVTAQALGSAITYLRRYGLSTMCGVVADDDDGAAASGTVVKPDREVGSHTPGNGNGGNGNPRRPTGENARAANERFVKPEAKPPEAKPQAEVKPPEPEQPTPPAAPEASDDEELRSGLVDGISSSLKAAFPGRDGAAVKAKGDLLEAAFGTRAWTLVQRLPVQRLAKGLEKIQAQLAN